MSKTFTNLSDVDAQRCVVYFESLGCKATRKGSNVKVSTDLAEGVMEYYINKFYSTVICSAE